MTLFAVLILWIMLGVAMQRHKSPGVRSAGFVIISASALLFVSVIVSIGICHNIVKKEIREFYIVGRAIDKVRGDCEECDNGFLVVKAEEYNNWLWETKRINSGPFDIFVPDVITQVQPIEIE